jgi:nucleoid-associated protein YgaU
MEPAMPAWIDAAPAPALRSAPTKPTPPSAGSRRHTVVKGDTLFSLAQRYYGNRAKWRDIYAANRTVLPSENSLRLGMELIIP